MALGYPGNSATPSPDSIIGRWLERITPRPGTFDCGLRLAADTTATVAGLNHHWRFRMSAVDRLVLDGVIELNHGTGHTWRFRLLDDDTSGVRAPKQGYRVRRAVLLDGAVIELALTHRVHFDLEW